MRIETKVDMNDEAIKKMVSDAQERGLTKAAMAVDADAKRNAPVDLGGLKGSISYDVDGDTATVGTNLEYAPFVEFGTGIHAEGGDGRKTPWMYEHPKYGWVKTSGNRPQPYLRPALDTNRDKISKIIADEFKAVLK